MRLEQHEGLNRINNCLENKLPTSLIVFQPLAGANHPHLVATLCSFRRKNGHPLLISISFTPKTKHSCPTKCSTLCFPAIIPFFHKHFLFLMLLFLFKSENQKTHTHTKKNSSSSVDKLLSLTFCWNARSCPGDPSNWYIFRHQLHPRSLTASLPRKMVLGRRSGFLLAFGNFSGANSLNFGRGS